MGEDFGEDLKVSEETPVKISLAAEIIGVSVKTVYNWITEGILSTVRPGYVLVSDANNAKDISDRQKSRISKSNLLGIGRDERGRFVMLKDQN